MELVKTNRKKIVIKNNFFQNGDVSVRIKGMNKRKGSIEELGILIEENEFMSIKGNGIYIDKISPGRFQIIKNKFSTFNTIAIRLVECRATKDDIILDQNSFASIYQIAICVDSSVVSVLNNKIESSVCGVFVYLHAPQQGANFTQREEILDSHKDIYYRESMGKESFIGISQTYLQANVSILGDHQQQTPAVPYRVIMKNNNFKDISKSAVIIQNNSSGSIKVEDCIFKNVKEPVVINEKDEYLSKQNTTKNILIHDNSELCAPSIGTPRMSIKGTIVVKNNKYEITSAMNCVIRKHVNSYLYDINNQPLELN